MKRPDANTLLAIIGLVALSIGLGIGLPPLALFGPGAALAVPGGLLILYAVLPDHGGSTP